MLHNLGMGPSLYQMMWEAVCTGVWMHRTGQHEINVCDLNSIHDLYSLVGQGWGGRGEEVQPRLQQFECTTGRLFRRARHGAAMRS